jgi:hypothetical protein
MRLAAVPSSLPEPLPLLPLPLPLLPLPLRPQVDLAATARHGMDWLLGRLRPGAPRLVAHNAGSDAQGSSLKG